MNSSSEPPVVFELSQQGFQFHFLLTCDKFICLELTSERIFYGDKYF